MRDIHARFKYSEGQSPPSSPPPVAATTASADPQQDPVVSSVSEASSSDSPRAASNSLEAPSREFIQQGLRKYTREVETKRATWAEVRQRIQDDLAPYAVLKLGGFALGNIAPKLLGHVLTENRNLRTLDLGFNRITDKGATLLAKALEQNCSLESLYLSGNEIGPAGVQALAQALATNTTLKSLHLSGNNIGEDGAKDLAEGLKVNTALRSLYIGTNGIGSNGMRCLAEALRVNRSLEELTLGQNKIGSEGIKHLAATFMSGDVSLTTLEIGKNGIDREGALALAKALAAQPNSLQNLYFDNNPIGDTGASAFGALLAKNGVLRVLDLSYTQMSLLGLRDLSMGLSYSTSLLCLLIDGHDWASTKYMKQTNGLQGMSLSAKGANHYAASCLLAAINANVKSVLFKLAGVDLSLVVNPLPPVSSEGGSTSPSRSSQAANPVVHVDGRGAPTTPGAPGYSDTLSQNERVLKYIQEHRPVLNPNKRKSETSTTSSAAATATTDASEAPPSDTQFAKYQRVQSQGNSTVTRVGSSGGSSTSLAAAGLAATVICDAPLAPSRPRPSPLSTSGSRCSLGSSFPSSAHSRLSLKSPRYETTMEVHVRKVVADLAKLPFNADEYANLQSYYLGGCTSPKDHAINYSNNSAGEEKLDASIPPPSCPACLSSRLARFRRTMVRSPALGHFKREILTLVWLVVLKNEARRAPRCRRERVGTAAPIALSDWRISKRR